MQESYLHVQIKCANFHSECENLNVSEHWDCSGKKRRTTPKQRLVAAAKTRARAAKDAAAAVAENPLSTDKPAAVEPLVDASDHDKSNIKLSRNAIFRYALHAAAGVMIIASIVAAVKCARSRRVKKAPDNDAVDYRLTIDDLIEAQAQNHVTAGRKQPLNQGLDSVKKRMGTNKPV